MANEAWEVHCPGSQQHLARAYREDFITKVLSSQFLILDWALSPSEDARHEWWARNLVSWWSSLWAPCCYFQHIHMARSFSAVQGRKRKSSLLSERGCSPSSRGRHWVPQLRASVSKAGNVWLLLAALNTHLGQQPWQLSSIWETYITPCQTSSLLVYLASRPNKELVKKASGILKSWPVEEPV